MAPPFKVVDCDILYGEGISHLLELVDLGAKHGIIQKAGAWYSYGDTRIGQGKDNARQFLAENPEMAAEIETQIRDIMMPKPAPAETSEADEAPVDQTS
jgi:recombination protein RecA